MYRGRSSKTLIEPALQSKVCRLCASKDGPFLSIFGSGMDLAKMIEGLLRILVKEMDTLPHKICFRCSAKISEFHEFMIKCRETQVLLGDTILKNDRECKTEKKKDNKIRSAWEAKLNKNKMSNEEFCNELVKKALESVTSLRNSITLPVKQKKPIDNLHSKMKQFSISLMKVNDPRFPGVILKNNQYFIQNNNVSVQPLSKPDETGTQLNTLPVSNVPSFSTVNAAGLGSLYSCNKCKNIFIDVDKVTVHKCPSQLEKIIKLPPQKKLTDTNGKMNTTLVGHRVISHTNENSTNVKPYFESLVNLMKISNVTLSVKKTNAETAQLQMDSLTLTKSNSLNNLTSPVPPLYSYPNFSKNISSTVGSSNNILVCETGANSTGNQPATLVKILKPIATGESELKTSLKRKHNDKTERKQRKKTKLVKSPVIDPNEVICLDETSDSETPPYPVGLLFRKMQATNKLPALPPEDDYSSKQYKILPPKKPGRIVIAKMTAKSKNTKRTLQNSKTKKQKKIDNNFFPPSKSGEIMSVGMTNSEVEEKNLPYFTFVNLEPMLRSPYVLSTSNTVPEPKISTTVVPVEFCTESDNHSATTTKKENKKYVCSICDLEFSREKKFIAHTKGHYGGFDDDVDWDN